MTMPSSPGKQQKLRLQSGKKVEGDSTMESGHDNDLCCKLLGFSGKIMLAA